jgi:hypothetical protein
LDLFCCDLAEDAVGHEEAEAPVGLWTLLILT